MLKIFFILWLCNISLAYATPIFDCQKAKTKVEKQICKDPHLSNLDVLLNELYQQSLKIVSKPDALKKEQIQWLKHRPAQREDLTQYYIEKIGYLLSNSEFARFLLLHKNAAEQYEKKCQKISRDNFGISITQSTDMTSPVLVKKIQKDKRIVQNLPYSPNLTPEACWKHFEQCLDTQTFRHFKQIIEDEDINILHITYIINHSPKYMYIGRYFPEIPKGLYKIELPKSTQGRPKIGEQKLFFAHEVDQLYTDDNEALWILSSGASLRAGLYKTSYALFAFNNPETKFIILDTWVQTYG